MYSINILFSYTLQSLNIILTSLTLDNIYSAVKRNSFNGEYRDA